MSPYDDYRKYLGRPYILGLDDCYGLLVDYYREQFDLRLTNFARPEDMWVELIGKHLEDDGWVKKNINWRQLQPGDAMTFMVASHEVNHVGVYLGNGIFMHHLYNRLSSEDSLYPKWSERLEGVYRHPKVDEAVKSKITKISLADLAPPTIKRKLQNASRIVGVVEPPRD